ncbi:hypothetical protein PROVRUST_06432 [Providencia rustigianii DSM 4541]|uniref:Uncharacterized protein n=1 Tax=Providencia rustigianii DSM 4541 TaxID=500637 RepID=D1P2K7_9GAMM|nr:hypothetical protein PROVRUST_06432 [Providencia rustigianii DSM 4541]
MLRVWGGHQDQTHIWAIKSIVTAGRPHIVLMGGKKGKNVLASNIAPNML